MFVRCAVVCSAIFAHVAVVNIDDNDVVVVVVVVAVVGGGGVVGVGVVALL